MPIPLKVWSACGYVSPRQRELTESEAKDREIAYSLKKSGSPYLGVAASRMARALPQVQDIVLCPVPSVTQQSIQPNMDLCFAIAQRVPKDLGVKVWVLVEAHDSVDSQCLRHKRGESPRSERDFPFSAAGHYRDLTPEHAVVFVDNVITSGNTIRACAGVFAWGGANALVFADARSTAGLRGYENYNQEATYG